MLGSKDLNISVMSDLNISVISQWCYNISVMSQWTSISHVMSQWCYHSRFIGSQYLCHTGLSSSGVTMLGYYFILMRIFAIGIIVLT